MRPARLPLVAAVAALALAAACGPEEGRGMKLKEGANLDDAQQCLSIGCLDPNQICVEIKFDFGRGPPICVNDDICSRLECEVGQCVIYSGFPAQVRCAVEP